MLNPRVKSVQPVKDYKLKLVFLDGKKGIYDCSSLLRFGIFSELNDVHYFNEAQVKNGTVTWKHGQDICPDTLYLKSKTQIN